MMYPSSYELIKVIPSRFSLIRAVTKRAKQLNMGFPKLVETDSRKPVSVAIEEILTGKVKIKNNDFQEKENCEESV